MGGKLSVEELAQRHVVIIGGGYAGMELGTILLKWEVPFTIIDPKEYFHHVVGGLRAVVDRGNNKLLFCRQGRCRKEPFTFVHSLLPSLISTEYI